MQVILLEDVKSLGKKGDLVNVSDGYARNFILPKNLGLEANSTNMNNLKLQKQKEDRKAAQELADARELAEKIKDMVVELQVKTGEGGKVFGSVSAKEIVAAVKAQKGMVIDKKKLLIDEPLKSCGMHIIKIRLHKEVVSEFKVHVSEMK